ncbi:MULTISPECIES: serine hydrolase, partial [unclassified Mycolicibacterium]|uniref:serine hydrolase domain-containing protein n=1 Tax=unclassified Mycolicibacterium TaxID=2636767 RepID=UPI001AA1BFF3
MSGAVNMVVRRQREFGGGARPGLAEWLRPPVNRWAFRHARELFWSERVAATDPVALPAASSAACVGPDFVDYLDRSRTDALVVLHDGAVAWEWYAQGVEATDRHILFSVSKSVVGLVASALIAAGVLDDGALVVDYVPEVAGSGYGTAKVRHLLDMSANIAFVEDYDGEDVRRYRQASGQLPSEGSVGIRDFVAQLGARGPHGEATAYVSPTTDLAGWVCERVTGRSLAELISIHVWGPMGGEGDGDLLLDRFGTARGSGGLCATARDMARIGQLLLSNRGDAATMYADVKKPGDRQVWDRGSLAEFMPRATYRSFWYQPAPGVFLAAGIFGQRIYVDTVARVVIAQQASLPTAYDELTWLETLPRFAGLTQSLSTPDDTT